MKFKFLALALFCLILLLTLIVYLYSQRIQITSTKILDNPNFRSIITPPPVLPLPFTSLSIQGIFSTDHSFVKTLQQDKLITLIATGDIIPARSVNYQVSSRRDYQWPYRETADFLKTGDITFSNFETPIFDGCPITNEGMIFCGDARNIEGLKFGGVDIVSLANNHAANHGIEGVKKTINLMNIAGILVTGIDGPVYRDIKGIKFAFLGYNDISTPQLGISNADEEKIKDEILIARQNADIVVATYHWGEEYKDQPDERQKYLGRFTIDAGADLVIGNHPHWIQPIEIYKGKLITYAHGNFIFDQMWSQKTREGVVGQYTFYDRNLIDVQYFPVQIDNYGQPHFAEGLQRSSILEGMKRQSLNLESSR